MTNQLAVPEQQGITPISQMTEITEELIRLMPGDPEAPRSVRIAAGQIALSHGLDPFNGEVYVYSTGSKKINGKWVKQWVADVGVKGFRRSARGQGDFEVSYQWMEADEVAAHIGGNYTPGDIGMICEGYRLDKVAKLRKLGLEVRPSIAYGFWRQKATWNYTNKKWMPDNIPASWTPVMVAQKRSEKNWIKLNFDLMFSDSTVVIDEPTNAPMVVMDEDTARLVDAYGTDGLRLRDGQRERAIEHLQQTEETVTRFREMTPDEKDQVLADNVSLMRGNGKKRLGEPIVIEEPSDIGQDAESSQPISFTPAEVLEMMRKERGGSVLEEQGDSLASQEPAAPQEPQDEPGATANGNMSDDELVIFEAHPRDFYAECARLIPRYADAGHAIGGIKKVAKSAYLPEHATDRLEMYRKLRDYAAKRDSEEAGQTALEADLLG